MNKVLHGDCLELMKDVPSGSVDMILCDLPYGNMKGADLSQDGSKKYEWDLAIKPELYFELANNVLRKNGRMILFSQEPYTTQLINEAHPNIPFNYRAIWEKDNFANSLLCNRAMVGYYEDILIFTKKYDTDGIHPLRSYFKMVVEYIGCGRKQIIETIGQRVDHTLRTNSTQFSLCTQETYTELIEVFGIDNMVGYLDYHKLSEINGTFNATFNATFNLWEGKKYKSNILRYKKDYTGLHPTQKPIALFEDLIKTYTNEGETVMDNCAGSGTTAIACMNTNRNYILMEKDDTYYQTILKRIEGHKPQLKIAV